MEDIIQARVDQGGTENTYAFVTGYHDVHKLFDEKQWHSKTKLPYLTLNELRALYPILFPILSKTDQFTEPVS